MRPVGEWLLSDVLTVRVDVLHPEATVFLIEVNAFCQMWLDGGHQVCFEGEHGRFVQLLFSASEAVGFDFDGQHGGNAAELVFVGDEIHVTGLECVLTLVVFETAGSCNCPLEMGTDTRKGIGLAFQDIGHELQGDNGHKAS